jgi:TonB family protein
MIPVFVALMLQGVAPPETRPAPPPPPPRMGQPARARANLASLISSDDYPASALRNEEEGVVTFRLNVGADGRVAACTITKSSGSAALDSTTCRVLTERARFTPARDWRGKPTTDTVAARIVWRIEDELIPMQPRLIVATLRVTPAGQVICSVTVNGMAQDPGGCAEPVAGMIQAAHETGRTATETMVEIVAPDGQAAPADPGNFGERFLDTQAVLQVAADGTIIECRASRLDAPDGGAPADGPCQSFAPGSKKFEPGPPGGPARKVIVTTRLYARH